MFKQNLCEVNLLQCGYNATNCDRWLMEKTTTKAKGPDVNYTSI
jgi:hypothetical protein